jgi:hypothetical protein
MQPTTPQISRLNLRGVSRRHPMQELEELQHLSTQELELAFRLVENPKLPVSLPAGLAELNREQWESVGYLLFLLRSAQMRSRVH